MHFCHPYLCVVSHQAKEEDLKSALACFGKEAELARHHLQGSKLVKQRFTGILS